MSRNFKFFCAAICLFVCIFLFLKLVVARYGGGQTSRQPQLNVVLPNIYRPVKSNSTITDTLVGAAISEKKIDAECSGLKTYGAKFARVSIPWNLIEPTKGTFDWSLSDKVINSYRSCGMKLAVYIYSRSSWAVEPIPTGILQAPGYSSSTYPLNIDEYNTFLRMFAARYKDVVKRYSIENEAMSTAEYASSPESYFKLLASAHDVIHKEDPQAVIENAPFSSTAVGFILAKDLYDKGYKKQSLDFIKNYFAHYYPYKSKQFERLQSLTNPDDLVQIFSIPDIRRVFTWANLTFRNSQSFDVFHIHYYGPWQYVKMATDWAHSNLQAEYVDKPIDSWEFGYGWIGAPDNGYDQKQHAIELTKLFAVAYGEGGSWIEQFELFDDDIIEGHPGIIDASGKPRLAAVSFNIIAEKFSGIQSVQPVNLGKNVQGYQFSKKNGTFYVLWSIAGEETVNIGSDKMITVTHIDGTKTVEKSQQIAVNSSPIFVE